MMMSPCSRCGKRFSIVASVASPAFTSSTSTPSTALSVAYGLPRVEILSPARVQLVDLIEEEKEKARVCQDRIASLMMALELVEKTEDPDLPDL